jgi:glycosyltransferase involved in cell wall biosynthesis
MKIVFVNRFYAPDHSATSQMLTDLATALAAGGADVHVVTSRLRYDDPSASLAPNEVIAGVSVHRVWTSAFGRGSLPGRALDYLSFYVTASLQLHGLLRRGDVVVAKTDPPLISVPAGWVARRRGARLVNWLQDIFPEVAAELGMRSARGAGGRLLRRWRDQSLRRAAMNVVLGRRMRDRLAGLGIDPRQIALIPNWADGAALRPMERDANPLRGEWRLDDKFVVGYSGNMGRVHEFDTIVGAAAALAPQPDIAFLFIGDGAQKTMIEALAVERGLGNLVFKPYQPRERLSHSLGVADVHLVTLRPELEGLVVPSKFYGIAAAGRPTLFIGDPDGEIGTVIREAHCGICVRQGDVAGLASAIVALRDDSALRAQWGRSARRVFEANFDKAIAVGQWRRLLDDAAGGTPAQPENP